MPFVKNNFQAILVAICILLSTLRMSSCAMHDSTMEVEAIKAQLKINKE